MPSISLITLTVSRSMVYAWTSPDLSCTPAWSSMSCDRCEISCTNTGSVSFRGCLLLTHTRHSILSISSMDGPNAANPFAGNSLGFGFLNRRFDNFL